MRKMFHCPIFAPSFSIYSKKKMIRFMRSLAQGVVLGACALCVASCGDASKKEGAGQMPMTYKLMTVQPTSKAFTTTYSAAVRGRYDASILPQVSGTIWKVMVKEGQTVRKGQSLFVIDQVPYVAALNTAKANVEVAKAQLATAELNYNSNKELYNQKVVSAYTLQTAENQYLTAKAQLAQANAALVNAQNNVAYTEVKSPSDGVVGAIPMREGTLVSPSMGKALTTVSDNKEVYVYFSMTENQLLSLIRQHGSAEAAASSMPAVQLQLNDGSMYEAEGKIESISGVIDKQTGTVSVRALFPNEKGFLRSGATASVVVPDQYENCFVIPQAATVQLQDQILVYKVVEGKAVSAIIKVAPTDDGREYVVLSGLNAGDEIVAEGAGLIREGTQVK